MSGISTKYPHRALTRVVGHRDRVTIFEWCMEHCVSDVLYNLYPGFNCVIRDEWTNRLRDAASRYFHPRKELFRFKTPEDEILFRIRWS